MLVIGVILPPVGIALYVACAITGAQVEVRAGRRLVLPVMLGGLVVVAFVP
jgi:TRAP-type C4-dicarboxylate transport system permease large subunit